MKYRYVGTNRNREKVSGVIDARDEVEAKLKLRTMLIRPDSLSKQGEASFFSKLQSADWKNITIGKSVDLKGLSIFTRQFSSLIDSGVPVVQCLDILYQQEKKGPFKNILLKIKEDIEGGAGLAEAFSKHPSAFSQLFVRIVEAGEVSGTLDTALRRIGVQLERLGRIKSQVIKAMVQPVITLFVSFIVLVFLLVKVIPEISKLYGQNAAKLPEVTIMVLNFSTWVQANVALIIGVAGAVVVGIPLLYKLPAFRKVWDPFVLHVPGFGALIKKSSIARFSRTLATLVSSGVPLINSFEICMKLMTNLAVQNTIQQAMSAVTEGRTIAQGLGTSKIFPPMVIHMVNIGEMTGKLDELLAKVADIYDDEVDDAVSAVTGLIQPGLMILVGGVVAFLLMAMYLPIFQLAEKVSG